MAAAAPRPRFPRTTRRTARPRAPSRRMAVTRRSAVVSSLERGVRHALSPRKDMFGRRRRPAADRRASRPGCVRRRTDHGAAARLRRGSQATHRAIHRGRRRHDLRRVGDQGGARGRSRWRWGGRLRGERARGRCDPRGPRLRLSHRRRISPRAARDPVRNSVRRALRCLARGSRRPERKSHPRSSST